MPTLSLSLSSCILSLLLTGTFLFQVKSYRILVAAPNYMYSHMAMHIAIADLLAEQGHEVTLFMPTYNPEVDFMPREHTNWTRSQRVVRDNFPPEFMEQLVKNVHLSPFSQDKVWTSDIIELFTEENAQFFSEIFKLIFDAIMTDQKLHATLREVPFDLAISEWFDGGSFALFKLLGIPATIATSAIPMDSYIAKIFGIPSPLYVPEVNSASPSGTAMGLLDRARTFYERMTSSRIERLVNWDEWAVQLMGPQFPSIKELIRNASFFFVNTNEHLDLARPISGKVKHIGGFTLKKDATKSSVSKMEPQIENLLPQSPKGSVLISFGSLADPRQMPPEMFQAFLDTFASFPDHTFIWKFSEEEKPAGEKMANCSEEKFLFPSNVHRFNWLNQRAILAHPKLRLFISHCGLNSLNEAAFEGVPLLCIPIFGDQNYNSAIVNQRRAGKVLLKSQLNAQNLKMALGELLAEGNEYAENMGILSRKMARAPFQPREVILRYAEFAAEFGGQFEELNLEGAKMSMFAYLGLDFLLSLALLAAIGLAILAQICMIMARSAPKYWHHFVQQMTQISLREMKKEE